MKKRYLICIFITFFSLLKVKATTITSSGSGNWYSTSTWAGGVIPLAGDDVRIASGHTVTVDAAAARRVDRQRFKRICANCALIVKRHRVVTDIAASVNRVAIIRQSIGGGQGVYPVFDSAEHMNGPITHNIDIAVDNKIGKI